MPLQLGDEGYLTETWNAKIFLGLGECMFTAWKDRRRGIERLDMGTKEMSRA